MIAVDKRELDAEVKKINQTLNRVSRIMKKDANELINQLAIFAVTSAAKETIPGRSAKISKMPKKFRFRPLVRIPDQFGFYYSKDGKVFKSDKKISPSSMRRQGISRVFKGIKMWNKKHKKFTYIPYIGNKRDESDARFKIPYAGVAKAGWLKALKQLSRKSVDIGDHKRGGRRYNRIIKRPGLVEIVNKVSYAAKISPAAAFKGLAKARSRFEKSWKPRVDRRIESNWRRERQSFAKGLQGLIK